MPLQVTVCARYFNQSPLMMLDVVECMTHPLGVECRMPYLSIHLLADSSPQETLCCCCSDLFLQTMSLKALGVCKLAGFGVVNLSGLPNSVFPQRRLDRCLAAH